MDSSSGAAKNQKSIKIRNIETKLSDAVECSLENSRPRRFKNLFESRKLNQTFFCVALLVMKKIVQRCVGFKFSVNYKIKRTAVKKGVSFRNHSRPILVVPRLQISIKKNF